MNTTSTTGTVKWFNDAKGYGFLSTPEVDNIFVHHKNINSDGFRTLNEGETVTFNLTQGPKGPQADNVIRGAV